MNLHGIVSSAISAVNPMVQVCVEISNGYGVTADGVQVAQYDDPQYVWAQIQPMSGGDLRQVDSLNLQGQYSAVYLQGRVEGLVRPNNMGGDKITFPGGKVYFVTQVLEDWPDWSKVMVTRQNDP